MARLFHVVTPHATTVCRHRDGGGLTHAIDGADTTAFGPIVVAVPDHESTMGLAFAPDAVGALLHVLGDPWIGAILPFRLAATVGAPTTSICKPDLTHYLCATPPDQSGIGPLTVDRGAVGVWEQFRLSPADPALLASDGVALCHRIDRFAALGRSGLALLQTLESDIEIEADLLQALGRLLPLDEVQWLGRMLIQRPMAVRRLAALLPLDVWARIGLPTLSARLERTEPTRDPRAVIDESLDALEQQGCQNDLVSFGQRVNAAARRAVAPSKSICILAVARNEGLYLLEWIAYHRAIGAEAIFLYSNNNDDGSDALLQALDRAGVIHLIQHRVGPGVSPQYKAYGHAMQMLPDILRYRWTMVIDLDEFFVFDTGMFRSIRGFLDWMETRPTHAIALSWLMYGSNGHNRWARTPLIKRFSQRTDNDNRHVKSICRTNMFHHLQAHFPMLERSQGFVFRNALGDIHTAEGRFPAFGAERIDQVAWINHYYFKSTDEFVWKRTRNRGDTPVVAEPTPSLLDPGNIALFLDQHATTETIMDSRAQLCCPGIEAAIESLLALPDVRDAVNRVEQSYTERFDRLRGLLGSDSRFAQVGTNEARLLDLVTQGG